MRRLGSMLVVLLAAGALGAQPAAPTARPAPSTVRVAPTGAVTRVQDALAQVADGGTIVIAAGVYREPTLIARRPVTLVGEPGAVLDGGGTHEILVITADDVRVRGLTFRRTGQSHVEDRAALRVVDAARCHIEANRFDDTFFGIYLSRVAGCQVRRNVLEGRPASQMQTGNGIHLWSSRDVRVEGNTVRHHRDGIYFEFARGAVAIGNTSRESARYGLHFMFSDSCRYEGNTFTRNAAGVAVMYARHVAVVGNAFTDNRGPAAYGLLLKEISDSEVRDNRFVDNSVGLHLEGSGRNRISGNLLEANGWAFRIMADAQDNRVTGNRFQRNTFDVSTNSRSNFSDFTGNWWDRYRGWDLDRDGRGDVPHAPVRLFAAVTAQTPATVLLLRSLVVDLLDLAERVAPALTPAALLDRAPLMRPPSGPPPAPTAPSASTVADATPEHP